VIPGSPGFNRSSGLEFYRRKRCVGQLLHFRSNINSNSDFEVFEPGNGSPIATNVVVVLVVVLLLSDIQSTKAFYFKTDRH